LRDKTKMRGVEKVRGVVGVKVRDEMIE